MPPVAEWREQITKTVPRAVLWPGCFTFADFAETVLQAAEVPIRPVDRLLKRQLLKQLVNEQLSKVVYHTLLGSRRAKVFCSGWINLLATSSGKNLA